MGKNKWNKQVMNRGGTPTPKQKELYKTLSKGAELPSGIDRGKASDMISEAIAKNGGVKPMVAKKIAAIAGIPKPKKAKAPAVTTWPPKQPPMPKECAPFKHLIPQITDPEIKGYHIKQREMKRALTAYARRMPALYNGEAGTGKTAMAKAMAFMVNNPYLCISADSRLYSRELLGQINIKNGTSFFQEGLFTMLTQMPSRIHVSEFNTQDPGASMFWQSINNERAFFIKEADCGKGKTYQLHKDCYISFDANPPSGRYNGTQRYNVAQLDRLLVINFQSWTFDEIRAILLGAGIPNPDQLAGFYVDVASAILKSGYRCMVSIRGILRTGRLAVDGYTMKEALEMGVLNQVELTGGPQARQEVEKIAQQAGL